MDEKITFEKAMTRLNEISTLMEDDKLPLQDALKLYSEASELTKLCREEIEGAKLTLKQVSAE